MKHRACLFQGWSQTEILRHTLARCLSYLKMLMQHDIEENFIFIYVEENFIKQTWTMAREK